MMLFVTGSITHNERAGIFQKVASLVTKLSTSFGVKKRAKPYKTFILKSCNRRFTIFILSLYIFFSILGLIKVNTNFPQSSDMIGSPISPLSKPQHNLIICRIVFNIIFRKYIQDQGKLKGLKAQSCC